LHIKKGCIGLILWFEGTEIKDAIDLTYTAPAQPLKLEQDNLTIIALPVYAGRLPVLTVERLKAFAMWKICVGNLNNLRKTAN
jgi:hypothetical protein